MTAYNRIIVIGATGYIGRPLLKRAGPAGIGTSSTGGSGLLQLDLVNLSLFSFEQLQRDDVVLMLAAISSPDVCVRQRSLAYSINVSGTIAFIEAAIARGAKVIFFSSDAVYGEQLSPFDESKRTSPVGEYARMKLFVEKRFSEEINFRSVRLSYVFSRWDPFTRYLFDCAEKGLTAEVFPSFARSVVSLDDVISGALSLANDWHKLSERVINFGGPEVLSRAEYAEVLRSTVLPDLRFIEKEPDESFFSSRPRKIAMLSPLMNKVLGRSPASLGAASSAFPR